MLSIKQIKKVQVFKKTLEACRQEINYALDKPFKIKASRKKSNEVGAASNQKSKR